MQSSQDMPLSQISEYVNSSKLKKDKAEFLAMMTANSQDIDDELKSRALKKFINQVPSKLTTAEFLELMNCCNFNDKNTIREALTIFFRSAKCDFFTIRGDINSEYQKLKRLGDNSLIRDIQDIELFNGLRAFSFDDKLDGIIVSILASMDDDPKFINDADIIKNLIISLIQLEERELIINRDGFKTKIKDIFRDEDYISSLIYYVNFHNSNANPDSSLIQVDQQNEELETVEKLNEKDIFKKWMLSLSNPEDDNLKFSALQRFINQVPSKLTTAEFLELLISCNFYDKSLNKMALMNLFESKKYDFFQPQGDNITKYLDTLADKNLTDQINLFNYLQDLQQEKNLVILVENLQHHNEKIKINVIVDYLKKNSMNVDDLIKYSREYLAYSSTTLPGGEFVANIFTLREVAQIMYATGSKMLRDKDKFKELMQSLNQPEDDNLKFSALQHFINQVPSKLTTAEFLELMNCCNFNDQSKNREALTIFFRSAKCDFCSTRGDVKYGDLKDSALIQDIKQIEMIRYELRNFEKKLEFIVPPTMDNQPNNNSNFLKDKEIFVNLMKELIDNESEVIEINKFAEKMRVMMIKNVLDVNNFFKLIEIAEGQNQLNQTTSPISQDDGAGVWGGPVTPLQSLYRPLAEEVDPSSQTNLGTLRRASFVREQVGGVNEVSRPAFQTQTQARPQAQTQARPQAPTQTRPQAPTQTRSPVETVKMGGVNNKVGVCNIS